jgi:hypothetical protein
MHGNVEKNLDDSLLFQAVVFFFLQIYSRGGFSRKHTSFEPQWAWVTHYYLGT